MLTCSNPEVLQGDPQGPPEVVSDNEQECAQCRSFIDLDDEAHTRMADSSIRCEDCREICAGCGEFVTDYKEIITMRCPALGKLKRWCIECAGDEWLGRLLEFRAAALETFDPLSAIHVRGIDVETLDKATIDSLWAFYRRLA